MYGKDYWKRINVKQVCDFFRMGAEGDDVRSGDYEKKYRDYCDALTVGMQTFKENVLACDWSSIGDDMEIRLEEMWHEALEAISGLNDLSYEIGFLTGMKISRELVLGE